MAKAKYNLINEQIVLAAVLLDESSRRRALACADRRDFFRARHRVIFKAVGRCQADGVEPEEAALVTRTKGDFGGLAYLRKLLATPVTKEIDKCLDSLRKDAARARVKARAGTWWRPHRTGPWTSGRSWEKLQASLAGWRRRRSSRAGRE